MKLYKDADWLHENYVDEGLTQCEIAKLCGAGHSTIARWMEKYDIPTRAHGGSSIEHTCETCGFVFQVASSVVKNGKGKFCSPECQAVGMSGLNNPNWRGGKVKCICKICGATFKIDPSRLKRKGKVVASFARLNVGAYGYLRTYQGRGAHNGKVAW